MGAAGPQIWFLSAKQAAGRQVQHTEASLHMHNARASCLVHTTFVLLQWAIAWQAWVLHSMCMDWQPWPHWPAWLQHAQEAGPWLCSPAVDARGLAPAARVFISSTRLCAFISSSAARTAQGQRVSAATRVSAADVSGTACTGTSATVVCVHLLVCRQTG